MAGLVIFAGTDGVGRDGNINLWVTDGTAAGTKELIVPGALLDGGLLWKGEIEDPVITLFGSKLLLAGLSNLPGSIDLWVSDGTAAGTKDLKVPGSGTGSRGLDPNHITTFGRKAIFAAFDAVGASPSPWVTDGTLGGTHELVPAGTSLLDPPGFADPEFTALGDKMIFVSRPGFFGGDLWVTDGTPTGTEKLTVPGLVAAGDPTPDFTVLAGRALFVGVTSESGAGEIDLWMTDGTAAGTKVLTVAGADPDGIFSAAHRDNFGNRVDPDFTILGKGAVFQGWDTNDHLNLWVTNGTSSGTKELHAAGANSAGLFSLDAASPDFTVLGGKAVFAGIDARLRDNLWVTDGTSAGTKELTVAGANSFGLFNPVTPQFGVLGNLALFEGTDAQGRVGLWVTDGTSAGTHELKVAHANPDGLFNPALVQSEIRGFAPDFTAVGGQAVFEGFDDRDKASLWITDGTSAGTHELMPAAAVGPFGLDPRAFTVIPNTPPSGLVLAPASDSGTKGDRITRLTKPEITGRGVAGNTVTLRDGTKVIGTAVVTKGGTWSVTPKNPLAAGVHVLTATETDKTLGISPASAALDLTIKTFAAASSGLSFAVAADKGSAGDTFTVAGKGEVGDMVTLLDGKTAIGSGKVGAGGAWSVTTATPLAIGGHGLSASEVDVAGNASAASPAQRLTIAHASPMRRRFSARPGSTVLPAAAATMCSGFRRRSSAIPTSSGAAPARTSSG